MLYFSITDLHYFTICLPIIMVIVSDTSTNFKRKTVAKKNKTFRKCSDFLAEEFSIGRIRFYPAAVTVLKRG